MRFEVTVTEVREKLISVEAEDDMNALCDVQRRWRDGDLDLRGGSGALVKASASVKNGGRKMSCELGEWYA